MPYITEEHHWKIPIALLFLATMIFGGKKGRTTAILALLVVAITDQVTCSLIKPWADRVRPCFVLESARLLIQQSASPSFPSAHAANNAAVAMLVLLRHPQAKWWFTAIAATVAYSRIYVGVHYPLDVLFGYFLGSCIACGIVKGWDAAVRYKVSHRPSPRSSI